MRTATQTPNAAVLAAMDGFAGDGLLPVDAEFAGDDEVLRSEARQADAAATSSGWRAC